MKRMFSDSKLADLLADLRSSVEDSLFRDCILGVLFMLLFLNLLDLYHSDSEELICNNFIPCDETRLVLAQVPCLLSEDVVALCFNGFSILYIDTLCYDDQSLHHASSFRLRWGVTIYKSITGLFEPDTEYNWESVTPSTWVAVE
ncbi:hypothetical protein Tco_1021424 [Tanacetum coccineum]